MAKRCNHAILVRGPDVPRVYGSWRSRRCSGCGKWQTLSHTKEDHVSKWMTEDAFNKLLEHTDGR